MSQDALDRKLSDLRIRQEKLTIIGKEMKRQVEGFNQELARFDQNSDPQRARFLTEQAKEGEARLDAFRKQFASLKKEIEQVEFEHQNTNKSEPDLSTPRHKEATKQPSKSRSTIPGFGEFLLYLFLKKTEREALVGDLQEEYSEVLSKFGRKKAKLFFYKQVGGSLWPLLRRTLIKWGLFGWAAELIRRIM